MPLKRPVQIENYKGITIRLRLLDSEGLCQAEHTWKADCFLLQWWNLIRAAMRDIDESFVRDITNTLRTVRNPSDGAYYFLMVLGGAGDLDRGVFVGTGTTPVEYDDYALETKIQNGAGAGQLQHGDGGIAEIAVAANRINLTISRNFTNASGGEIIINEIGIQSIAYDLLNWYRQFLVTRDIVTDGFAVGAGETVAASITLFTPF